MIALALALAMAGAPKPAVKLSVYPPMQLWRGNPTHVRVRARVSDPGQELSCPEIAVDFGDGCRSSNGDDECDVYGMERPRAYVWPLIGNAFHPYRQPGEYEITACVVDVKGNCRSGLTERQTVMIGTGEELALRKVNE